MVQLKAFLLLLMLQSFFAQASDSQLKFTPQNGFGGLSYGDGTLKLLFKKPVSFHVESNGYQLNDGSLRLDQSITFQGQEPKKRHWIIKSINTNTYSGTLSDANGKVKGKTQGSRLTLKYRIKGPLFMHQTLDLLKDGKTIDNVGKITMFGIPIGTLRETIIRKD